MPRCDTVGTITQSSNSGSWDSDVLEFIRCAGRQQTEIHDVWTFGDYVITPVVHTCVTVDVGAFIGDCFEADYLTENGSRGPMFGRKLINGSFEWVVVPDFFRSNGPPWTINLLAPCADLGLKGPSTNKNLSSGSGGYSDSIHINWNHLARELPIYHRRVLESTRRSGSRTHDNLLR